MTFTLISNTIDNAVTTIAYCACSMSLHRQTPQLTLRYLYTCSGPSTARVPAAYATCTHHRASQQITRQKVGIITRTFQSYSFKAAESPSGPGVSNRSDQTASDSSSSSSSSSNNHPANTKSEIARRSKQTPKTNPESSPIQLWPFLAILVGGTLLFKQLLESRAGTQPPREGAQIASGPSTIAK